MAAASLTLAPLLSTNVIVWMALATQSVRSLLLSPKHASKFELYTRSYIIMRKAQGINYINQIENDKTNSNNKQELTILSMPRSARPYHPLMDSTLE
jgi:hypothetical protein